MTTSQIEAQAGQRQLPEALREIMQNGGLRAVFQPIVSFEDATFFGYEALIRGPVDSPLHSPLELLRAAREAGITPEFEIACCGIQIRECVRLGLQGKLFLNLSGDALAYAGNMEGGALHFILDGGLSSNRIVVELTEHERIEDPASLHAILQDLRRLGLNFALDDFGDGRSSLRLWSQLQPEIVKIDKYFIQGVQDDAAKCASIKALVQLAEVFGARLVAEGIETEAEFAVVRDLGVSLGQGYLLGRPDAAPSRQLAPAVAAIFRTRKIAVFPETVRVPIRSASTGQLAIRAPAVSPTVQNDRIARLFSEHPDLHALPVVDGDRAIGIINRRAFMDRYAQPYQREVYGRKPCTMFMNDRPLLLEKSTPLESLTQVLTGEDQRYLSDGFIVTDEGRYAGIGTGESLVRAVSEIRIEAARYANPLTFLPGNIPISEHIARLLGSSSSFTACYFDLNQFKPFNDRYGYWRGDKMIKLAAEIISRNCDPLRDFLGHVGGDDFIVLFQSDDWRVRCEQIVVLFNLEARGLYDTEDIAREGIEGEDRHGNPAFFPVTTMSVGAVPASAERQFRNHEDVASAAATAKHQAKLAKSGLFVLTA
jgi:diguanylate cyclase (GGDEF)-like protein